MSKQWRLRCRWLLAIVVLMSVSLLGWVSDGRIGITIVRHSALPRFPVGSMVITMPLAPTQGECVVSRSGMREQMCVSKYKSDTYSRLRYRGTVVAWLPTQYFIHPKQQAEIISAVEQVAVHWLLLPGGRAVAVLRRPTTGYVIGGERCRCLAFVSGKWLEVPSSGEIYRVTALRVERPDEREFDPEPSVFVYTALSKG